MIITGLDLSLASTGLAKLDTEIPGVVELRRLRGPLPKQATGAKRPLSDNLARLDRLTTEILAWCEGVDLVGLEGPSFGSARPGQSRGHWERGGLWWCIRLELFRRDVPVAQIPPSNVKIYSTGNGRADKAEVMLHMVRRCPWAQITGEDTADAFTLAAMCAAHEGQPVASFPKTHTRGLMGAAWPERQPGRQAMLSDHAPWPDGPGTQAVLSV